MKEKGLLYVIIDRELISHTKKSLKEVTREIINAQPDLVQLRCKNLPVNEAIQESLTLSRMAKKHTATKFLINDRVDIAKAVGADGVHLGREDLPSPYARKILGKKALIGKTVHSSQELKTTLTEPVDYISIGPVFKSRLKNHLKPLGIKKTNRLLNRLKTNRKISFFVIGGITVKNVCLLIKEGITNVAVASDIISCSDPKRKIREFKELLNAYHATNRP